MKHSLELRFLRRALTTVKAPGSSGAIIAFQAAGSKMDEVPDGCTTKLSDTSPELDALSRVDHWIKEDKAQSDRAV